MMTMIDPPASYLALSPDLHRFVPTAWDLPRASRIDLINVSENGTFRVDVPDGRRFILRMHRQGYNDHQAIRSELAWMAALRRDTDIRIPDVIAGRNGELIQHLRTGSDKRRDLVMFEFLPGKEPHARQQLEEMFTHLGSMAATCHNHSLAWQRPPWFKRFCWDIETVFGDQALWGDWRSAPALDARVRSLLERLEKKIKARLRAFGKTPENFGLIHADMRLANLLSDDGPPKLIDFDDCGFGWHLYDFAAGISFIEDDPQIPALKDAWITGYVRERALKPAEIAEIDTFVMLRRMALLAWIGTHSQVETARELAPSFAPVTADLAEHYLSRA